MKLCRAGDRSLQFLILNEEFLVSASQQLALITSLPFVHTARRYYRLNGLVRSSDWSRGGRQRSPRLCLQVLLQYLEVVPKRLGAVRSQDQGHNEAVQEPSLWCGGGEGVPSPNQWRKGAF